SYLLPVRVAGGAAWFRLHAYVDGVTGSERIVLTHGVGGESVLVRVQRLTLLDRFPLRAPRFRGGWDAAVARIVAHGRGVVLFADADEEVADAEALLAAHVAGRRALPLEDGVDARDSAAEGRRLLSERV